MGPDKNTLNELRIDRSKNRKRSLPTGWIWAGVLLIILLIAAIWWFTRPRVTEVRSMLVRERSGASGNVLLNASGYVTARREATVSSKVTGKVREVLIEEGMRVTEGQVLARLDSANAEKNLQLAEARLNTVRKALDETNANLIRAKREWDRVKKLAAEKVISPSELDVAEAEATSLEARLARQQSDVDVATSEVALARQDLDDTIIRAPFAGIVTSKNAQPGEMISPMSAGGFTRTGICTIVDMNSLEIEVDVNESYINRVEPGQPVEATLDSYPDWRIPSRVIAIIPTADRHKATVKVRVGFEKLDPRMLPDMAVKVAFMRTAETPTTASEGIFVPQSAVQQRDGRPFVWIVREGRVERRDVTVGTTRGTEVSIQAGLSNGDRIVIGGGHTLDAGASVVEKKR